MPIVCPGAFAAPLSKMRRKPFAVSRSMPYGDSPSGPAAHNRGDRTDETDESRAHQGETLAYYREVWHLAAVPGLRIRVSTRPLEPGFRVVDQRWEARMKCSVKGQER